jgi:hypothetical protein
LSKRIAVFIDGENVSHRFFPQIREKLQRIGDTGVLRIYADWSLPHVRGWKPIVLQNGIRTIHKFQNSKNSTDTELIMDAIDILNQQPDVVTFCIVSSDSDYRTLCLRLRDRGKTVVGIGEGKSSQALRDSCSAFYVIETPSPVPGIEAVKVVASGVQKGHQTRKCQHPGPLNLSVSTP